LIPEKWRLIFAINPLSGLLDAFRWPCCRRHEAGSPAISFAMGLLLW
jgi:hypothetical protein